MKKTLLAITLALAMCSCGNSKWEYKTMTIEGYAANDYQRASIENPESQLNKLGEEGWELVSSYTQEETVFPNFGNSEYVTGLRSNTRTSKVVFVLKRKK